VLLGLKKAFDEANRRSDVKAIVVTGTPGTVQAVSKQSVTLALSFTTLQRLLAIQESPHSADIQGMGLVSCCCSHGFNGTGTSLMSPWMYLAGSKGKFSGGFDISAIVGMQQQGKSLYSSRVPKRTNVMKDSGNPS